MPLDQSITEEQIREMLSQGTQFMPRTNRELLTRFPGLSDVLGGASGVPAPATPTPGVPSTPGTPGTPSVPGAPAPGMPETPQVPDFLSQWNQLYQTLSGAQQGALAGRIPGAVGLEQESSNLIAQLLNPPSSFADVNRRAAEVGAGRGISGSEAAFGTGLRMTDEERLRRQLLGQQMLSQAYERNPIVPIDVGQAYGAYITPAQQASLDAEWARIENELRRTGIAEDELELRRQAFFDERSRSGMSNQWINIAGTGYPANWARFDPTTGRWM